MSARRTWRTFAAAWAVGLTLRAGVALLDARPVWDGVIYARAAEQLARGEGYTLRILAESAPAVPTAFYPVGYPAFLAALHAVGLSGTGLLLAQALVASLSILWAGLLGRRLGGARAARIAAWLAALHPGSILLGGAYLAEPVYAAFFGGALTALAYARRRHLTSVGLAVGIALGVFSLMRPVSAVAALVLAVAVGWTRGSANGRARAALAHGAVSAVLVVAALSPWMLRNERALGSPVPISTNAGFNLLLGTVELGSYGPLPEGIDCDRALGEVDKDRCRRDRALARIAESPLENLGRALWKVGNTFGHESSPARYLAASLGLAGGARDTLIVGGTIVSTLYLWLLYALGVRATFHPRLSRRVWAIVIAPIVATAIVHALVLGGDRYHLAVMPVLFALAARGLSRPAWPSQPSAAPRSVAGPVSPVP